MHWVGHYQIHGVGLKNSYNKSIGKGTKPWVAVLKAFATKVLPIMVCMGMTVGFGLVPGVGPFLSLIGLFLTAGVASYTGGGIVKRIFSRTS